MLEDVIRFHASKRIKSGGMTNVLEVKLLVDGEIREPKLIQIPHKQANKRMVITNSTNFLLGLTFTFLSSVF